MGLSGVSYATGPSDGQPATTTARLFFFKPQLGRWLSCASIQAGFAVLQRLAGPEDERMTMSKVVTRLENIKNDYVKWTAETERVRVQSSD